jgi:hypothetical protein
LAVAGIYGQVILDGAAAPMLDPLAFKAVSYGLILLLAFTGLMLFLVSLRKEFTSDRPLRGLFPFALYVTAISLLASLATAYVQLQ